MRTPCWNCTELRVPLRHLDPTSQRRREAWDRTDEIHPGPEPHQLEGDVRRQRSISKADLLAAPRLSKAVGDLTVHRPLGKEKPMQRSLKPAGVMGRNCAALFLGSWVLMRCGPPQAASTPQVLLQVLSDNVDARVASQPEGIRCGTQCAHPFDQGTVVQLTAVQLPGTYGAFASWGGACSGNQPTCRVPLQASQTVIANWATTPGSQPPSGLNQLSLVAGGLGGAGNADGIGRAARLTGPYEVAADRAGNLNGDYVSDYISWLTTTCRSRNHEYFIYSAGRQASAARSAA